MSSGIFGIETIYLDKQLAIHIVDVSGKPVVHAGIAAKITGQTSDQKLHPTRASPRHRRPARALEKTLRAVRTSAKSLKWSREGTLSLTHTLLHCPYARAHMSPFRVTNTKLTRTQ